MDSLRQHIKNLPKADVHNHLHLGASQKKFKKHYPKATISFPETYDSLDGMIAFIFEHINTIMVTKKDVIQFMELAIQSSIDDNITQLEASIDLGLIRFFNNSTEELIEAVQYLKDHYKSQIDFKPDLGFNKNLNLELIYKEGVACIESGVFNGIDCYGKEAKQDLRPFRKIYDIARLNSLKTKVHIGEFSDYKSIESAIKVLHPNELQHGIRAVDSKSTLDLILEHNIQLNIGLASNLSLGAVKNIKSHPIRALYDYGIKITVNTDDLILFNQTLTDEYLSLIENGIFSLDELEKIRLNALC